MKYSYDGVAYLGCASALSTANGIGRRTAMCDGAGQESSSYDALGRVLTDRRTTNSVTKDFSYAYNFDSSLASLTYPNNRVVTYAYNAAGRALSAVDAANSINYALNASYAPHGAVAAVIHGQSGGFGGITTAIGFFTSQGQFTSFEVSGSAPMSTGAFGINDRGQVVGTFTDSANPNLGHGFLRDGSNFTTIDFPNADSTLPTGVNERGDVVGNCFCIEGRSHGFLLSNGIFTVLDFPVVDSRTRARGINDRGQIVGFYRPGNVGPFHGFIATPTLSDRREYNKDDK